MSKHDWEEAAEILGLEIRETQTVFGVSGTPVLMTGTVSRLPVTVVYDGGGQGEPARTKLRVVPARSVGHRQVDPAVQHGR